MTVQANRIDRCFAELNGRAGLVLYVTGGHPNLELSETVAATVAAYADIVEIGIPFSDPVADGPVIQASSTRALEQGTTVRDCLELAQRLRASTEVAIVFLTYYNPVLSFGLDAFAEAAEACSADGVICPDLPAEEAEPFRNALNRHGLYLIPLVAPTSTSERLQTACAQAAGFIYCVSRTGVTGQRQDLDQELSGFLDRVRQYSDLPRAVGFGISTPEQVTAVAQLAEGVIVGSALISLVDATAPDQLEERVREFARGLRQALAEPSG
jgi:tryptophan synthase alpha chain